jgi:hypothetical protein
MVASVEAGAGPTLVGKPGLVVWCPGLVVDIPGLVDKDLASIIVICEKITRS